MTSLHTKNIFLNQWKTQRSVLASENSIRTKRKEKPNVKIFSALYAHLTLKALGFLGCFHSPTVKYDPDILESCNLQG